MALKTKAITNKLSIRRLTKSDVIDFFELRLESLKESPSSFRSSYEEEKNTGSVFYENLLASNGDKNVIFGAFVNDKMIGTIGIYQEKAAKASHKCKI